MLQCTSLARILVKKCLKHCSNSQVWHASPFRGRGLWPRCQSLASCGPVGGNGGLPAIGPTTDQIIFKIILSALCITMSARTDGQTQDPQAKSSWWAITSYDQEDEWKRLSDPSTYPSWLKKVYGGEEICPTSGKHHLQITLNTSHIRFTQVKSWLGKSHIEKAIKPAKLIEYCMKKETAAGEKVVRQNPRTFLEFHDLCEHLAYYGIPPAYREKAIDMAETNTVIPPITESMFWTGVNFIIYQRPDLASSLSKFNMNFWLKTAETWLAKVANPGWSPRLVLPEETAELFTPGEEIEKSPPLEKSPGFTPAVISHE